MIRPIVVIRQYPDRSGIKDVTFCSTYDQVAFLKRLDGGDSLLSVYEDENFEMQISPSHEINEEGLLVHP